MQPLLGRILRLACCAGILACTAVAQSSGFTPGELIYYSDAIPGMPTTMGGILRIDPVTGATFILKDIDTALPRQDAIAYDPYRQRLVFYGSLPSSPTEQRLYFLDGFGNTTPMGSEQSGLHAIAPASGGRIYFARNTPATPHGSDIAYLDANDQLHVLMDPTGSAPFQPTTVVWGDAMVYDAGTNALFVAVPRNSPWNCGTSSPNSQVIRIELSADGSRVTGSMDCVEVVVDATLGSAPVGLTHGPNGQLAVVIHSQTTGPSPRMQLIDPVTMTGTPFAWSQHSGDLATLGGTWSSTLGRIVIVDAWTNVLRSFAQGEVGGGTVITTSMPISGSGSGEGVSLLQITPEGCGSAVGTYCVGKVTSGGCLPTIATIGSPSATASSSFRILGEQVTAGQNGVFFYGLSGPASVPFQGGTLCVQGPVIRTDVVNSGGVGPCGGVLAIDFNAYLAGAGGALVSPGDVVHGQFWFRDPAHPIGASGLTNGVTFTVCP